MSSQQRPRLRQAVSIPWQGRSWNAPRATRSASFPARTSRPRRAPARTRPLGGRPGAHATVGGAHVIVGNARLMADHGVDVTPLRPAVDAASADGQTAVYVARDATLMGVISVSDVVRPESAAAIANLRQRNIGAWLLTGDNRLVAESVAAQVGITADHVIADGLPADKQQEIKNLQDAGRRVAMVGDGLNDAPALAQADVGVAIGTGTDVAIEASDVTLMGGDTRLVVAAIALSARTMRTIRQNLFWAFAYNVVLIPVAMGVLYPFTGILLAPVLAAAAMAFSSGSVVANSLLLRRFTPRVPLGMDEGRLSTRA